MRKTRHRFFKKIMQRKIVCSSCGLSNPPDAKFCEGCTNMLKDYDAFISYRRESGSELTSLIGEKLNNIYGKEIFIDVAELQVGRFDEKLLKVIEKTKHFILILSPGSLDRCVNRGDWLKQEIMQAMKTKRNIIPVMTEGFKFPKNWNLYPDEMKSLENRQAVLYSHIYQDASIEKIQVAMKLRVAPFVHKTESPQNEGIKQQPKIGQIEITALPSKQNNFTSKENDSDNSFETSIQKDKSKTLQQIKIGEIKIKSLNKTKKINEPVIGEFRIIKEIKTRIHSSNMRIGKIRIDSKSKSYDLSKKTQLGTISIINKKH